MGALSPAERVAPAQRGQLTSARCSAGPPPVDEVPLVDGDFFFNTALSADADVGVE